MLFLILLAACDAPCETYGEDAFWADLEAAYCERHDRCDLAISCAETRSYIDYQRQELLECGATFNACVGSELVEAATTTCDGSSSPKLFGEVYTPECPRDTGR